MKETETINAVIESATIDTGDRNLLTIWLQLSYGGSSQGFGGYSLYLPKSYKHFTNTGDFAGHFIFRCMEIAGVGQWKNIVGKTIRVVRGKGLGGDVISIGHIVKDDWFTPKEDFEKMLAGEMKSEIKS